jgi:hypothetical protein
MSWHRSVGRNGARCWGRHIALSATTLCDGLATAKAELAASTARCAVIDARLAEKDASLAERLASTELLRQRLESMSRRLETARAEPASVRPARRSRSKAESQGRASIDFAGGPFIKRPTNRKR